MTSRRTARFPQTLVLPFGYRVSLRRASPSAVQKRFACEHCGHASGPVDGFYDPENRIVWIDKNLSIRQQREVLDHELGHVLTEWRTWLKEIGLVL